MAGWTDTITRDELALYTDSGGPGPQDGKYYLAKIGELARANLEPSIYFELFPARTHHGKQKPAHIEVSVWPGTEPLKPGRYMREKPAKIVVNIERPEMKFPLVARLGTQTANLNDFKNEQGFPLPEYREGEEERWKISASFQFFEFKT